MPTTRLAQLIARAEGFFVPGGVPQRNHNPGDLRHAPGEAHDAAKPDGIGTFATDAEGWAALERQLQLWASRGLTLGQAIDTQLGIVRNATGEVLGNPDSNAWEPYLELVMQGLAIHWLPAYGDWQGSATPMTAVLKVPAIQDVTT